MNVAIFLIYFDFVSYAIRIKEAFDHAQEYIKWLARLSDAKLEKRLNTVQAQIGLASANKQLDALKLLHIWERIIIEARILKYDRQPQLDELTKLEMAMIEITS